MGVKQEERSSVPRRLIGRELRRLREQAGEMAQEAAARRAHWSAQKLWRTETGRAAVTRGEVQALCELYGASPHLTAALVALAPQTKASGWWHEYRAVPHWFELYVRLERAACRIREYQPELIPGYLQTRDYASAIIEEGEPDPAIVRHRLNTRLHRAHLLTRLTPVPMRFQIVLNELAIRQPVGNSEIMASQLRRIAEVSEFPNVSIRIKPIAVGVHRAAFAGGLFAILDFAEGREPTTVYSEGLTGSAFLDKPADADHYAKVFEHSRAMSLPERESRDLLLQVAEEYDRDRPDSRAVAEE